MPHLRGSNPPCTGGMERQMSEEGWKDFLADRDLTDWVVLHGGAAAVFRTDSLESAGRLGAALSAIPLLSGQGVQLAISDAGVTVRLNRDVWRLEVLHQDMARAISIAARSFGASADRSAVQEVQVAIAAKADQIDLAFWRAVLGYSPMADDNAVDPLGHGSTVWMQEISEEKSLCHAMHIDVSVARDHVKARLDAGIAAGGRIVDDSRAPSHWTLSDRAGNRVCVCAWPDTPG